MGRLKFFTMAIKSIIDKVEETSPEFIEATRIFFKAELNKKNKQLKECQEDLEIVKKQAELIGANIEVTKLVNNFYKDIQDIGGGNWDTSSLLKRLQD